MRNPLPTHLPPSSPPGFNAALQPSLQAAAKILHDAPAVLLTAHVNPDGDAIGSILALGHGLHALGKRVDIVMEDNPPRYCSFLPGIDQIQFVAPASPPPIAVVCDAAGLDRIGFVESSVQAADRIIEIDHHAIARPFGQVRVVDDTCFATAEIIYHLLGAMDVPLTAEIATCLMMGVVTDTGAFRFTNVNTGAFELAARLMNAGADLVRIMDYVYEQKTLSSLRLLERALTHLRCEDGFASATLSLADFAAAGADQTESEGIIGQLRSLGDVKVAAVLREAAPGEVRVSLRGRPGFNVAAIAAEFAGGGHEAAAGCTIHGTVEEAEERLRSVVKQSLRTTI